MSSFMELPFVKAYIKMFLEFANFRDRASRADYWWAVLGSMIVVAVLGLVCALLGVIGTIISWLYSIAMLVPSLAIGVRRLHDIGKSGYWYFIAFVPLVGGIILLIFMATNGQPGDNQYGADPSSNYGY